MKNFLKISLLAATIMSSINIVQAQQAAVKEDFKPSELNQPQHEYPMVNSRLCPI